MPQHCKNHNTNVTKTYSPRLNHNVYTNLKITNEGEILKKKKYLNNQQLQPQGVNSLYDFNFNNSK